MSRIVNLGNAAPGWFLLFEGEEETPLPRASTRMTKLSVGSTSASRATFEASTSVVPENQVGKSTPFDFA
jgi:hypothetical protein